MPSFLAQKKKTKTKRPVRFETKEGVVNFNARRKPKRRTRVEWWNKTVKKKTVLEGNVDHLFGGEARLRTNNGRYATDSVKKVNDAFWGKKKKR